MNRRKFVAGLGALAASGGAAIGTGAFTSVTANRTVSVNVSDEAQAYLGIEQGPAPNGDFASEASGTGEVAMDFNDSITTDPEGSGTGVGQDSTYDFDAVFTVSNQGTQTVYTEITDVTYAGGYNNDDDNDGDDDGVTIEFYVVDGGSREVINGSNASLELGVGSSADIGVRIKTSEPSLSEYNGKSTTITAQSSNFGSGNQVSK